MRVIDTIEDNGTNIAHGIGTGPARYQYMANSIAI